jgi:hypothetical protein
VNGSRIAWKLILWFLAPITLIVSGILPFAVIAMMIQIVLAHWFTIVIFAVVFVGFPLAAHLERSKR